MNIAHRLIGPRGKFGYQRIEVRSTFCRFEYASGAKGWRWVPRSVETGQVLHVIDFPDSLEGCYDTPEGALWALRACAAHYFHTVRSHRGH